MIIKKKKRVINNSRALELEISKKEQYIELKKFDIKLFWLLGDYGKYDKNISYKHKRHIRLIKKMGKMDVR